MSALAQSFIMPSKRTPKRHQRHEDVRQRAQKQQQEQQQRQGEEQGAGTTHGQQESSHSFEYTLFGGDTETYTLLWHSLSATEKVYILRIDAEDICNAFRRNGITAEAQNAADVFVKDEIINRLLVATFCEAMNDDGRVRKHPDGIAHFVMLTIFSIYEMRLRAVRVRNHIQTQVYYGLLYYIWALSDWSFFFRYTLLLLLPCIYVLDLNVVNLHVWEPLMDALYNHDDFVQGAEGSIDHSAIVNSRSQRCVVERASAAVDLICCALFVLELSAHLRRFYLVSFMVTVPFVLLHVEGVLAYKPAGHFYSVQTYKIIKTVIKSARLLFSYFIYALFVYLCWYNNLMVAYSLWFAFSDLSYWIVIILSLCVGVVCEFILRRQEKWVPYDVNSRKAFFIFAVLFIFLFVWPVALRYNLILLALTLLATPPIILELGARGAVGTTELLMNLSLKRLLLTLFGLGATCCLYSVYRLLKYCIKDGNCTALKSCLIVLCPCLKKCKIQLPEEENATAGADEME